MKVELYLDIFLKWHPTVRSKYLFFITSHFSPDGLIMSINRSINEKGKKPWRKKMIDIIDLHFNLLAIPILYNNIWQNDGGIVKKKRKNEIMCVCVYVRTRQHCSLILEQYYSFFFFIHFVQCIIKWWWWRKTVQT